MPGIPLTQIKNGCAEPWFKRNRSWWTSAELNRGLTDLDQAFYMLSLWSIPPFSSPQTNSEKAGSRKSPLKGRKQTFESVPH